MASNFEIDNGDTQMENNDNNLNRKLRLLKKVAQTLQFILDSSSSESDDSDSDTSSDNSDDSDSDVLLLQAAAIGWGRLNVVPRPKIDDYLAIIHQYSDEEFRRNFRLSRTVATDIILRFQMCQYMPHNLNGGSTKISAEINVLSFLWYAGNPGCIRDISARFGIAESSLYRVVRRVMNFLTWVVAPTVISFPETESEKLAITNGFELLAGIPDVLGCIDGSYIYCRTPSNKPKTSYINRHDHVSITMQGICDNKKRFLDVFTGVSSKMHDARVLNLSFISEDLHKKCGHRHILGDAAYPLREYLVVPFKDYGNLSRNQVTFNFKHCQTRVCIENAFGMLKNRFRRLRMVEMFTVEDISMFIMSCCVLHNLCVDNNDIEQFPEPEEDHHPHPHLLADFPPTDDRLRKLGETKRNHLVLKVSDIQ